MTELDPRGSVRSLVASFLFADLAGLSGAAASEQHAAKAILAALLRGHLSCLREADYRIRDTGHGVVVAFTANPEHALYLALAIAEDQAGGATQAQPALRCLRVGINLGAVRASRDFEGRPDYVGDGIDAAKRLVDACHAGDIVASRSFFDAVANLDASYGGAFRPLEARDGRPASPHAPYAIARDPVVLDRLARDIAAAARDATGSYASTISQTPATAPASLPLDAQPTLSQAVEVVRKWFIPINALIAFTAFAVAGLERVAPHAKGIRIASAALFAVAIVVGGLGVLRSRGVGARFWQRFPRMAFALASRPTSIIAIATAVMLGVASIFLGPKTADTAAVATTVPQPQLPPTPSVAHESASATAPAAATMVPVSASEPARVTETGHERPSSPTSAGDTAAPPRSSPPPAASAAVSATVSDAVTDKGPGAGMPASVAVTPTHDVRVPLRGPHLGSPPQDFSTPAAPPALQPPRDPPTAIKTRPAAAAPTVDATTSRRCNNILEKAALGEPLSQEEKRELANSCH